MKKQQPIIISGGQHTDARGTIKFNNALNLEQVKRMYTIENCSLDFVRAWQGHQVEQRWFAAVRGSFKIKVVAMDTWPKPSPDAKQVEFVVKAAQLDVLHVPARYITSIQQLEEEATLMVYADYKLGAINDECKLDAAYFNN
jgi:dTDP-4-dehydrorhamnose 3,5-epimerase-like enzyme